MSSRWQEDSVHIYRLEPNGRRPRYCDNRETESVQDLPVMAYRSGSYKRTHGFTPKDLCIFCIDKAQYIEPETIETHSRPITTQCAARDDSRGDVCCPGEI